MRCRLQAAHGRLGAPTLMLIVVLQIHTIGCGESADHNILPHISTATPRGGGVALPTVEGPVSGGKGNPFIASTTFDLAQVGYSEAEYFFSGTATAYTNSGLLSNDGHWTITPGDTAAYKTRLLVYRPTQAEHFNGTVVVEWLNVSQGVDESADWLMAHTELTRAGFVWIGVSAQRLGVEGGPLPGGTAMPLKTADPDRYDSLVHPGDTFSYDIFSQAAQALRRPAGANPLGDLAAAALIASGESQSAYRLVTYIDAVHPHDQIYDGFLVHSRGGNNLASAPLSEHPQTTIAVPGGAQIRSDLDVPVLTFETETDLISLGYAAARQADSDRFRLWEVAGTAHVDAYFLDVAATDRGDSPAAANLVVTTMPKPGLSCPAPINSGAQHFVLNAAFAALNQWVRQATLPHVAPRIAMSTGAPLAILRDVHGNALGGVRTPQLDAPIAVLSGDPQAGSLTCIDFGRTALFDQTVLAALYADHDTYVAAFATATDQAVQAGVILAPDAALMKAAAVLSDIGA